MSVSSGYSKYTDDRDPNITEMIADTDTEAQKRWHDVHRIDANAVTRDYLFSQDTFDSYQEMKERHDAEFRAWMAGDSE